MDKKITSTPELAGLNIVHSQENLDSQTVLSNARVTFNDHEISAALVEIAHKLQKTPEGIQGYAVKSIDDMLKKTGVVIDTSMSVAIASILTDRGNAVNDTEFQNVA